jgi:hypothetical protein
MSAHDIMAIRLIVSAMSGNLKATNQVYDRLEGKPKQAVEQAVSMYNADEWLKLTPMERIEKFKKHLEQRRAEG